jgi:hypothetical protein
LESIPQILRYCIYEVIYLAKIKTGSQGIEKRRQNLQNGPGFLKNKLPFDPADDNFEITKIV